MSAITSRLPDRKECSFSKLTIFCPAVNGLGNPSQKESQDMLSLDTKDIAQPTASALISSHYENGKSCFHEFLKKLESEEEITFYEPIKKNRIDVF